MLWGKSELFFLTFNSGCLCNMDFLKLFCHFLFIKSQITGLDVILESWEETEAPRGLMACSRPTSPWDEPLLQLTCLPMLPALHHREKKRAVLQGRNRIPSCQQRHSTPCTYCTLLWELIVQFPIKQNGSCGWSGSSEESAKWRPELLWMVIGSSPQRGRTNVLSLSAKPSVDDGLIAEQIIPGNWNEWWGWHRQGTL